MYVLIAVIVLLLGGVGVLSGICMLMAMLFYFFLQSSSCSFFSSPQTVASCIFLKFGLLDMFYVAYNVESFSSSFNHGR